MITHTIVESYWIKKKRRKSQSYKFKEFAKISDFCILKQTLHMTHPQKLLDKMCKYEMDLTNIVEDTERTQFYPQTDRQTMWNQYTSAPFNFVEAVGIKMTIFNGQTTEESRLHCLGICYFDGLVQDCSNSIANSLELLQSCTKISHLYTML